jgi:CXXC-20-CXXC protein
MTKCQNCGKEWHGKVLLKRYITLDPGMDCPYCGETQYLTKKYRRRSLLAILLLPLLIFVPLLAGFGIIVVLITLAAIISAIIGVQLFTIELANTPQTRRDTM